MPKKYKQKSLLTKPASSSPSALSLSRSSIPLKDEPSTRTVNDLIRASRRENATDTVPSAHTSASIPPSLRAVLNVPTPLPPPPRHGLRGPTRLRRIPGPAPPRSWLSDSNHAPPEFKNSNRSKFHEAVRIQDQSSILPEGEFPPDNSLQHLVLKAIALHWSWHAEYDQFYLADLPTRIKQILLSYIAIFSEGIKPNPIHLLFPTDLPRHELDEVRRLDLGNAIGVWSTLKKIEKDLDKSSIKPAVSDDRIEITRQNDVPDTWDEDEVVSQTIPSTPAVSGSMRFRNLKHLSLAVAPGLPKSSASWASLLSLAGKMSTITSLSLAFWPQPTYTPNASTGRASIGISGSTPRSAYGGSDFYTAFDNDWREAAGILRSLSRSLYCLKWLDLTGCGDWFGALVWKPSDDDVDEIADHSSGPDWNGSWRGLEHIVLAVGWSLTPLPSEESFRPEIDISTEPSRSELDGEMAPPLSTRSTQLLSQLSTLRIGAPETAKPERIEPWNVEYERAKYYHKKEVERYDQISKRAKSVIHYVRRVRKEGGGKWITAEIGLGKDL